MSDNRGSFIIILVVVAALVVGGVVCVNASQDSSQARRALESEGWSNVSINNSGVVTGFEGCGSHDDVYYEASGSNPAGKPAKALVCCGAFLKACTVRVR